MDDNTSHQAPTSSAESVAQQPTASSLPPHPPPLPPSTTPKPSSIALQVRSAPPGWAYDCGVTPALDQDPLAPPTGLSFFYETLQDPAMLSEILDLPEAPTLRPVHVIGYHLELWGQYPALVDGPPGHLVHGSVWEVPSVDAAAGLAAYETRSYHAAPCNVYEGRETLDQAPLLGFAHSCIVVMRGSCPKGASISMSGWSAWAGKP
ncbi:putative poly(A) polymerase pla1 [Teratosphaeria destructans]|uniref:Poly(A) polymerase pla1 n=1 Tax=Teratosphaeria destructans TaxID=418781 RepID=A0A9W7SXV0_9PEZI|nr:putative poly(A) polymerase pla1 [Teratosphaeria destructans]